MLNNFQAGCRSGHSPFDLLAEAHNKIPVVDLHYEQAWNGLAEAERQEIYREYRQLIQELQSKEKHDY